MNESHLWMSHVAPSMRVVRSIRLCNVSRKMRYVPLLTKSHIWISHVARATAGSREHSVVWGMQRNETCHTYEWVPRRCAWICYFTHLYVWREVSRGMWHVTHMNESCPSRSEGGFGELRGPKQWDMSHIWMSLVTYEWVMSQRVEVSSQWCTASKRMRRITHMSESRRTHENKSRHTCNNETCQTYKLVMSHIWMSHVAAGRREHSVVYGIQKYGGVAVQASVVTRCCVMAVERSYIWVMSHTATLCCTCESCHTLSHVVVTRCCVMAVERESYHSFTCVTWHVAVRALVVTRCYVMAVERYKETYKRDVLKRPTTFFNALHSVTRCCVMAMKSETYHSFTCAIWHVVGRALVRGACVGSWGVRWFVGRALVVTRCCVMALEGGQRDR